MMFGVLETPETQAPRKMRGREMTFRRWDDGQEQSVGWLEALRADWRVKP